MTVRGLLIAVEEYDQDSGLARLPGTVQRALDFRTWLIGVKGAAPDDVLLCSSPRCAESAFGASDVEVLKAIKHLIDVGQDKTTELFVFHTGHGFQWSYNQWSDPDAVIVGETYQRGIGGRGCLRVPQLRTFLAHMLGGETHVWFVDACRVDSPEPVGDLNMPEGEAARLGTPDTNWIFASPGGAAARSNSAFVPALLAGLRGEGQTVTWIDTGYFVTFDRLSRRLESVLASESGEIDAHPKHEPTPLCPVADVPTVTCDIEVEDADPEDQFVVRLHGAPGQHTVPFKGGQTTVAVRPGSYGPSVSYGTSDVVRVAPLGNMIEIYEPITLRFRKGGPALPSARVTFDLDLGPDPDLHPTLSRDVSIRIAAPSGDVLGEVGAGHSMSVAAGSYDVSLLERGTPIGSTWCTLEPGGHMRPSLATFIQPSAAFCDVQSFTTPGPFMFALDLDKVMPQPGSEPDLLVDPDPALVLTVLGAASICDAAPYRDLIEGLPNLDDAGPGTSAIYVLDTPADGGDVEIAGIRAPLEPVAHLESIACAVVPVAPGPVLVGINHPELGPLLLSSFALANRATLIVLARDEGRLSIRVHVLPIGHLAGELYPRGAIPLAQFGLLHALRFADRVQRQYGRRGLEVAPEGGDGRDGMFLKALTNGVWPDPITPIMTVFAAIRSGALRDGARAMRRRVRQLRARFGDLPDLAVLEALVGGERRPLGGRPVLLDALLAANDVATSVGDDPGEYALAYDTPWVMYRRAVGGAEVGEESR